MKCCLDFFFAVISDHPRRAVHAFTGKNCLRFVFLSLFLSLCVLLATTFNWTDSTRYLSSGYNSLIPLANNDVNVNAAYKCKSYIKMKRDWAIQNNSTGSNSTNEDVTVSVLPSVCLKSASQEELTASIQPTNCANNVYLIWLIKSSIYRNTLRKNIRNFWGQDMDFVKGGNV